VWSVLDVDRIRIGVASFSGFDTPVELARCKFDARERIAPSDFSAELVDASAPDGDPPSPAPVVELTAVTAEETPRRPSSRLDHDRAVGKLAILRPQSAAALGGPGHNTGPMSNPGAILGLLCRQPFTAVYAVGWRSAGGMALAIPARHFDGDPGRPRDRASPGRARSSSSTIVDYRWLAERGLPARRHRHRRPSSASAVFADVVSGEQRFRSISRVLPVGVFQADVDGRCSYANDVSLSMVGIALGDAVGEGWIRCLHPDDRDRVMEEWQAAALDGRDFRSEYRFCKPTGETIWVLGHVLALKDEDGDVIGHVGAIVDITDRKHSEIAVE
jgi:PAS domain S-box-containing protein